MKRILSLLSLVMASVMSFAHGNQVAYCVLSNGYIRVYIEHWHGDLTVAQMQGNTINVTTTYGTVTTTQNINVTGVANNTGVNNLPGCTSNIHVVSTCNPGANSYNDWGYWDFAPAACNVPVTITVNAGNTVVFDEACTNLYPATVSATFNDNAGPIMNCPSYTVNNDQGRCGAIVNYAEPTATDACQYCPRGSTISGYTYLGNYNGHDYYKSNTTGTWNAQNTAAQAIGGHLATINDAAENSWVASASVGQAWIGYNDEATEGTFVWTYGTSSYTNWSSGEPNNVLYTSAGEDYTTINWGSYSSGLWNDLDLNATLQGIVEFECITPVRTSGPASGSFFPVGSTTVTYSATDNSNNTSTCSFTVTVRDVEYPAITCPANTTVDCQASTEPSATGTATATDNCSATVSYSDQISGVTPGCANRTITRTWTATDPSNNTSSCTQTIDVRDMTPPTAVCKNITVDLVNGVASISPDMLDGGSTDDCSSVTATSVSKSRFTCADAGQNNVTVTFSDGCGNTSSCTAVVTVRDRATCSLTVTPDNTTHTGGNPNNIYFGYGSQSATVTVNPGGGSSFTYSWAGNAGSPMAYLSCTDATCKSVVFTPTAAGNYSYTVTVTNEYGCSTTCTVNFCVKDIRCGNNNNKVNVCHIPTGNPSNAHTNCISVSAVPSHLAHGDYLGQCGDGCSPTTARMSGSSHNGGHAIGDQVNVYPNPTGGIFTVEIPYTEEQSVITVTDVQGKTVIKRTIEASEGQKIRLDLASSARGVYFVEVFYNGQSFRTRLSVQ